MLILDLSLGSDPYLGMRQNRRVVKPKLAAVPCADFGGLNQGKNKSACETSRFKLSDDIGWSILNISPKNFSSSENHPKSFKPHSKIFKQYHPKKIIEIIGPLHG